MVRRVETNRRGGVRTPRRRGNVNAHTRTVNGRQIRVKEHTRKLNPSRAWRNTKRAVKAANRKKRGTAFALGALALGEIGLWATARTTSLGLTAMGLGLVVMGLAARKLAR